MDTELLTSILLLILANNLVTGGDVPGRLITVNAKRDFSQGPPSCTNKYGPICGDCNTIWTCVGSYSPITKQNCAQTHPGKPYCWDNACVSSVPTNSECAINLRCTSEGYFPNPINCNQYYFCGAPSGASRVYECPNGFAYNPHTNQCKLVGNASDCNEIDCTANENRYVAYTGDPGYYAFCFSELGVSQPVMFKCPDSVNFQFNQASQRCEFVCQRAGRLRDYTNCQSYYECFSIGNSYINQRGSCLDGFIFNEFEEKCVVGRCNVVATTTAATTTTEKVYFTKVIGTDDDRVYLNKIVGDDENVGMEKEISV